MPVHKNKYSLIEHSMKHDTITHLLFPVTVAGQTGLSVCTYTLSYTQCSRGKYINYSTVNLK